MPFLAQRYRLVPDELAIGAGLVVLLLVAGAFASGDSERSHGFLWCSVVLMLTLDFFGFIALIRVIVHAGSDLQGVPLLLSAMQTWIANVAGFALLYWFLNEVLRADEQRPSFLFPEDENGDERHGIADYLFVAVSMALAFGPTDTPPANTTARCAVMAEALVSFVIIALVAARAINAIG
jgi:uncharacterized membrane protein